MKKDLRGVVDAASRWGKASARVREAQGGVMAAVSEAKEAQAVVDEAEAEFRELVEECAKDLEGGMQSSGEAVGRAGRRWRSALKALEEAEEVARRAGAKLEDRMTAEEPFQQAFLGAVNAAPEVSE